MTVENKGPNLAQDEEKVAANGIRCEFAHENIILEDELEWDDQECTGRIIPAEVVFITQVPFGRKLIHCTYDHGKSHADYPDRFKKKRNDT